MTVVHEIEVLVTGFGPYPDGHGGLIDPNTSYTLTQMMPPILEPRTAQNPSATRIRILRPPTGYIPTEYRAIRQFCHDLHRRRDDAESEQNKPPAAALIVHLGEARGLWNSHITVERCAFKQGMTSNFWDAAGVPRNQKYYTIPDAVGEVADDLGPCPWGADVPVGLQTALDVDAVADKARGVLKTCSQFSRNEVDRKDTDMLEIRPHMEAGFYGCGFIYYETLAGFYVRGRRPNVLFCHVPGREDARSLAGARDAVLAVIVAAVDEVVRDLLDKGAESDAMTDPRQGVKLQLSPWADRFGQSASGAWAGMNGMNRSGLAPEIPALHETYYASDFQPSGDLAPLPKPTLTDLDSLFMGEQEQTIGFGGFKTWELGPLNNTLYGGFFGGHHMPNSPQEEKDNEDAFDRGRLVIDESSWLPWFQRDNWWENQKPDTARQLPGRKHFSVDDDEVWKELRVCLELANRILSTLIDERHPIMVAAALNDLDPNAPPDEKRIRLDPEDSKKFSKEQLRDKITKMGEDWIISSFLPDRWNIYNGNTLNGLWFLPIPPPDSSDEKHTGILGMATFRLRVLVEGKLTVAERCMAQFAFAKTLCHETMHALFAWHSQFGAATIDPVINDEMCREIGRSFENLIFGGHVHPAPTARHFNTAESWTDGNILTLLSEPFPSRRNLRYGGNAADLPELADTNIVPLLWVSALLSEKFWQTDVAKYGAKALKMPHYVKSTTKINAKGKFETFGPPGTLDVDTPLDSLRDRLRTTALDFNTRRLKWTQLRPWYPEEGFKWLTSPWGRDGWRSALNNFKLAHARRDQRECFRESRIVMSLYRPADKRTWLFFALGLLMRASMPLRREAIPTDPLTLRIIADDLFRSKAAEKNPHKHRRVKVPKRRGHPADRTGHFNFEVPRTSYTNPLDHARRTREVNKHMDWLNFFSAFCGAHKRLDPLPRGWHQSLFETQAQLLQSRTSNPACAHYDAWAPFDFKAPPYDPQWQTWDWRMDAHGGMQEVYVDRDPPLLFKDTPEARRTNLDRQVEIRDQLDRDARRWFGTTDPKGNPVPYFTVSEVGAHREAGDAWLMVPAPNGAPNIWDVTAGVSHMKWTTEQFRNVTRMTNNGLRLRTGDPDPDVTALVTRFLKETYIRWRVVGKLAIPQAETAVRENDGSNGLPLYKTYGKEVYDLTQFNCPPHWRPILLSNPGGPIDETLDGYYPAMVAVLSRHRCGTIMDLPSVPRPEADLTVFTASRLRWYDNPTLGVYFAVDGFVYDMSNYLESHPGGLASLKEYAGKDASKAFAEAHATNPLLTSPYDGLRIGRMVEEIPSSQKIQEYQVVLDTWVYNISPDGNTSGLFDPLKELGGQDASEILNNADASNPHPAKTALESLVSNHQSRIVARVEKPLLDVGLAALAEHNDPADGGAWVAIGDNVWDIMSMMVEPEWYNDMGVSLGVIQNHAGEVVSADDAKDDEAMLKEKYPHLLVARLVSDLGGLVENMNISQQE